MKIAEELGMSENDPQAREELIKRIEALSAEDQRYLSLRFQHGFRPEDIANVLHQDRTDVEVRLKNIINKIRPQLIGALITVPPLPARNFRFNGKLMS